eukprot:403335993
MGQAIACCSGDSDRFEFTATPLMKSRYNILSLENDLRPKQSIEVAQQYPVRGGGAIFISRESLPNVDDKYIMKQQKSMSRAHQNKSAGSPTKDGVPDAGDSYQPNYYGYNSGSISNGTREYWQNQLNQNLKIKMGQAIACCSGDSDRFEFTAIIPSERRRCNIYIQGIVTKR